MTFAALLAALVLAGAETLAGVYVLAVPRAPLVFDAPERHALTFQMVGRAELQRASRSTRASFSLPGRGPRDRGRADRRFRRRRLLRDQRGHVHRGAGILLLMRTSELVPVARSGEPPTMLRGIREGFSWVLASPQMRLVLAIVTVVSTVGFNFHVILPLLAEPRPGRAGGLRNPVGELRRRCPRRGALRRARASELEGARRRHRRQPLPARAGPLTTAWACALLLFVTGVCFTLWTSNANSILQLQAPDHLRGRVVSLYLWAFAGFAPSAACSPAGSPTWAARSLRSRRRHRADDDTARRAELTRRYPGRVRFGFTALTRKARHVDHPPHNAPMTKKRSKALWVVAALLVVTVLLAAQPGLAPRSLGNYFFGPKLVRAEVVLRKATRSTTTGSTAA